MTVPLDGERRGQVTVSFGTAIWPDSTKVVYAWVTNIGLTSDDRLGAAHRAFTSGALIGEISKTDISIAADYEFEPTGSLRRRLDAMVGRPVLVSVVTNLHKGLFFEVADSGGVSSSSSDASIPGVDIAATYPYFDALAGAYFEQDEQRFQGAVAGGVDAGVFVEASTQLGVLAHSIRAVLAPLRTLDAVFMHMPLGLVKVIGDVTAPTEFDLQAIPCPPQDASMIVAAARSFVESSSDYPGARVTSVAVKCEGDIAIADVEMTTYSHVDLVTMRSTAGAWEPVADSAGVVSCSDYKRFDIPRRTWTAILPSRSEFNGCRKRLSG